MNAEYSGLPCAARAPLRASAIRRLAHLLERLAQRPRAGSASAMAASLRRAPVAPGSACRSLERCAQDLVERLQVLDAGVHACALR